MSKISFNKEEKVVQDLGVKPIPEYKKLVVGEIVSITLDENVSESKTGYQFTGFSIPAIVVRFKQSVNAFNSDERFNTFSFRPVVTLKNSGVAMVEDTISSLTIGQFKHLKHILDTFEGTPNFKALGKLPDIDTSLDTEDYLKAWKAFYEAFMKAYAGKDGEGCYKGVQIVTKFIVNPGTKRLSIPNFVNKGYMQIAKFDKAGKLITTLEFYGETTEVVQAVNQNNTPMPGGVAAPVQEIDLNAI